MPERGLSRPAAALAALATVLCGCGPSLPDEIPRVVGGERREGPFVSPFAYEHYVRGELAFAEQDYERAARHLQLARTGPEDDPYVIARLAMSLEHMGAHEEADGAIEEGLALDRRSEAVWLARGEIAEMRGELDRAVAAYERAREVAPSSEAGVVALAKLLRERGDAERAAAVLREHARLGAQGSMAAARIRLELALTEERPREAAEAVEHLLRIAPARADEVQRAAELAFERGRPLLAAQLLEHLPRRRADASLRVRALLAAGRRGAAEGILATAPPEAFGGRVAQASLYLEAARPERAIELAEAAAAIDPSPGAWLIAGRAALQLGRYGEAADWLARVPPGVEGHAASRIALADTLRARALPHLAAEVLAAAATGPTDDPAAVRRALERARAARDRP